MNKETIRAFEKVTSLAQLLADMPKGIQDIKMVVGLGDKKKLESLLGFAHQAEDIIKNMKDYIAEALDAIDKEQKTDDHKDTVCGCLGDSHGADIVSKV